MKAQINKFNLTGEAIIASLLAGAAALEAISCAIRGNAGALLFFCIAWIFGEWTAEHIKALRNDGKR